MNPLRIKWLGVLILLMMAVRVSITPGVRHRHEHGNHPHSHHHGHSHLHGPHSHSHEPIETASAETHSSTSHVHIFIFGWELTFSSPFPEEDSTTPPPDALAKSPEGSPEVESAPLCPVVTSTGSWGTLLGWVFELRSPAPPAKLELPKGMLIHALALGETGFASRDRDKPMLPPPECGSTSEAAR